MPKLTRAGFTAIACLSIWCAQAMAADNAGSLKELLAPPAQDTKSTQTSSATHEQQWLVDSIGKDIAEMILFAAQSKGAENIALDKISCTTTEKSAVAGSYSYALRANDSATTEPETYDEHLCVYLWNPENFSPWADQLLKKYKLTATTKEDLSSIELIKTLSQLNSSTLAKTNKEIAKQLTADPLNATWHERAALVIATLSLRESAACFTDTRSFLNRVSAHLAIARALRGGAPYGDAGKLAEATLMSLSKRSAEAMQLIKSMQFATTDPTTLSWLRGLEMRNTTDPRISKNESTMEQLEYARALCDTIGSDQLTDYLKEHMGLAKQIDCMRIGVRGIASVEAGHLYAEPGVRREMQDFIDDYAYYHETNANLDPEAELSKPASRCLVKDADTWELQPLSWSDVAAFHCRHLLDAAFQAESFERHMWGVPDYADETAKRAEQNLSKVLLYPLLKTSLIADVTDKTTGKATLVDGMTTASVAQLVQQHPELVNAELWYRGRSCSSIPAAIPDPDNWFVPGFLYGTAYDFESRCQDLDKMSLVKVERLRKISPYDFNLCSAVAYKKYGDYSETRATPDQLKEIYGQLVDYDLNALNALRHAYENADPAAEAQFTEKIAAMSPNAYFSLGDLYLHLHQPEKAVVAFENGVSKARDDVNVSNNCQWLVRYYDQHGQAAKAVELAQRVADVYSARGLETLALQYERMGKLADAELYFNKESERYDNNVSRCAFYMRHEKDDKRYKQEASKLSSKTFPEGMTRVTLKDFTSAPTAGVAITSGGNYVKVDGLKIGDVIVANKGHRINNTSQWELVKNLIANDDDMELIVWNGQTYRVMKVINGQPQQGWAISTFKGAPTATK